MTITVAFYVKAGAETGYGHIVRCLALADELRERGCECQFRGNIQALARADLHGYGPAPNYDFHTDVWIVDLEGGCPPDLAARLSQFCHVFVILNGVGYPDGDPGRLLADLVFYQGRTERPRQLAWPGFEGDWFEGPEWLILRKDFQSTRAQPGTHAPPRVVVTGGGSDPKDITGLALRALHAEPYQVRAIVGPANGNGLSYNAQRTEIVCNPDDMAAALAWGDVAVISYGMTAFECLALGLPVVALSISSDHAESAALVQEDSGTALWNLGEVEQVQAWQIRAAVEATLDIAPPLSSWGRHYCDGRGAARVAEKILETLASKTEGLND